MPTYRLAGDRGVARRVLRALKMCFLNVLRLHVSQNQRQKRLYKQYMEQLAGAYVERRSDADWRECWREDWREDWRQWECSSCEYDSGRCSSPCCSEVIFNGGQHFAGKRPPQHHACRPDPVCYPGNFA